MPAYKPIDARLKHFGSFVPETHCVEFTGHLSKDGYGKMNGGKDFPGETLVHRLSYLHWVGPISEGLEIDHRCNNRKCFNPQHLQPIPHASNVRLGSYNKHRNAMKTLCKRGHPLFGDNLYIEPKSQARKCRTCNREKNRRASKIKRALMEACHGIIVREV